jgi:acyl dehydratase
MRYFEDIVVGTRIELGSHTFEAEEIKAFARKYDPQSFHVDEAAAARSHFGRLVASGWHTAAVGMRLTVDGTRRENANARTEVVRTGPSPGVRDLKWPKPVFVGDTISYATEIVELRASKRPGWGLMVTRTSGTNQHGELVYSVQGAVFVERRPAQA